MCGRLHAKIGGVKVQEWNLLGIGDQDSADRCEREREKYGRFFEIAEYRRDNPDHSTVVWHHLRHECA